MVGQYLPDRLDVASISRHRADRRTRGTRAEKLPLLRDPDVSYYLRQERDGLLLGPYEWKATPHWLDKIPDDFAHQLYPDDLDRLETYIEAAIARVPILGKVGVQRVINGPDPLLARRQSLYRPRARPEKLLPVLLLFLRHRAGGRRGQNAVGMDHRRRAGMGFLDFRSAPLHRLRNQDLCRRQGDRALSERIRHRLSARRAPRRPPREDDAAL